jgi:N-acetylmuramoyl-L-alanine amidase
MKICIDAGHGGSDPGASFKGLLEKDVTLKIILRTGEKLESLGHDIIYTRTSDTYPTLPDRARICNTNDCEIFVSVHTNADPDPDEPGDLEAQGEEIWYLKGGVKSRKLAEIMERWIDAVFPDEPFRGLKESENLYVLKHTNCPAILIEVGFIDKSSTNETLRSDETIDRIAELISNGLDDYSKLV